MSPSPQILLRYFKMGGFPLLWDKFRQACFSQESYLVLCRTFDIENSSLKAEAQLTRSDLGSVTTLAANGTGIEFKKLEPAAICDLLSAWPREFSGMRKHLMLLERELLERFATDIPGFGVWFGGNLGGALWCTEWEGWRDIPETLKLHEPYEIKNFFILDRFRGWSLGGKLLTFAGQQMALLQRCVALSRVMSERHASLTAHRKAGFVLIGCIREGCLLGRYHSRFTSLDHAHQ